MVAATLFSFVASCSFCDTSGFPFPSLPPSPSSSYYSLFSRCRLQSAVFMRLRFPCYSALPSRQGFGLKHARKEKALLAHSHKPVLRQDSLWSCVSLCLLCRSQIECEGESFVMRLPPRSLSRLRQESDHLHRAGGNKATLN